MRERPGRRRVGLAGALGARILWFLATLCGSVGLVLALLTMAPGDPIDLMPNADEVRPQLEREWNLDRPLPVRYVLYVGRVVRGDLGTSLTYRPGMPVSEVIAGPALRSLGWLLCALGLSVVWGTGLAWFTAGRRSSARALLQVTSIVPVFLLAHLAVTGLNTGAFRLIEAGLIHRPDWFALPDQPSLLRTCLAVFVLAIGSGALSELHADVENTLVRLRGSGFVDAARARGAPTWPHVALNLVPPLAALVSARSAFFVGGLVILEKVLLLNGVGAILWQAALLRDYDLALGISLLAAAVVCTFRLVGDGIRIAVDPRLRQVRT